MQSGLDSNVMEGPGVDERTLLAGLRAGDDAAFEELVRRYGGRLMAVARRFVSSDHDAQDVVQSAYLSAFRALPGFEGHCRLSTWLHRIVVNSALMKLRSRRRRRETSIEDLLPDFDGQGRYVEQFPDWAPSVETRLGHEEKRRLVRGCIEQLPDNYRTVLLMRDIEELPTQEVANILGTTATAVKVRLHRARQALVTLIRRQEATSAVERKSAA
jgi:RNA polymerase sigma-70 factor (ECF subfamily)